MQGLKAVVRFLLDYIRWTPVILLYTISCYIAYYSIRRLDILITIWLIIHIVGYPIVAYSFLTTKINFWSDNKRRPLKEGLQEDCVSCYIWLLIVWPILLIVYLAHILYTTVVNTYRKLDIWAHDQSSSEYVYKFYIHYKSCFKPQVYSIHNAYSEAKLAEKAWLEKADMLLVATTYIKKEKRYEEENDLQDSDQER